MKADCFVHRKKTFFNDVVRGERETERACQTYGIIERSKKG